MRLEDDQSSSLATLVLVRHGESEGNARNIFTGRLDLPLTERGRQQAIAVAERLRKGGAFPDVAFSSTLTRTRESAGIILAALGSEAPVIAHPELDERDYGDLTGLEKDRPIAGTDPQQVEAWRRSLVQNPPNGESLLETVGRVRPFYNIIVKPRLAGGETILIVAHGNSLRALLVTIEFLTASEIEVFNIDPGEIIAFKTSLGEVTGLRGDLTTIDSTRGFNL